MYSCLFICQRDREKERGWHVLGLQYSVTILKIKVGKSLGSNHRASDQTSQKVHISEK